MIRIDKEEKTQQDDKIDLKRDGEKHRLINMRRENIDWS